MSIEKIIRVLLVEDEETIGEAVQLRLELEDYEVVWAKTGAEAVRVFERQRFNVIVLDIMLPEMDGYEVCERIRLTDSDTPILFLSAKNTVDDKLTGLKKGGDDYLTKPFVFEEFILRVKVLVKHSLRSRREGREIDTFQFGDNRVNFSTFEAIGLSGEPIQLSQKEANLLKLLIEREGEVVSREDILRFVWGYDIYPSTRTVDNFIATFRKYFEVNPRQPRYFHSVRGVGYRFTA